MLELILSPKYKAFLRHVAKVEVLEGTTASGKTTVGAFKFMLRVAASPKKTHVLSGLDLGTIEKNIINKELGILECFGGVVKYYPAGGNGLSMPYLTLYTDGAAEQKIIYILGYDNKARWKKALGGQYGCLMIDEINIADIDYVREASMRCDYLLATLNPDDPDLPIYSEYVNHCRPLPEWASDIPSELLAQLDRPQKQGWVHWFFGMNDNMGLSEEKKQQIVENVPTGTKLYKNKILGLRGRATGLIFGCEPQNIITQQKAHTKEYVLFTCGVDTSFSKQSDDTLSFVFQGITRDKELIVLEEFVKNNRDIGTPISPSDVPVLLSDFLNMCREKWGFARDVFIDSADAGTITECEKFRRQTGSVYNFLASWKKTRIISRIELQKGWMARGKYLICEDCTEHIRELNSYCWKEDRYEPEDRHDHTINASQYGWLPFKERIGEYIDKQNKSAGGDK